MATETISEERFAALEVEVAWLRMKRANTLPLFTQPLRLLQNVDDDQKKGGGAELTLV